MLKARMMAISKDEITALCALAKAGFNPGAARDIGTGSGWNIAEDEVELGFLRFDLEILQGHEPRSLVVEIGDGERSSFAFVGLFCFPELEQQLPEFRGAFDSVAQALEEVIGEPSISGDYGYAHRAWRYAYHWWSLPDTELVLVQDEFDIQSGFDVTLWILRAGSPRDLPVRP